MPPQYKPRDFEFSNIIQGMNGLQVDPVTLDEAINQARKLEQEGIQTQAMRDAEKDKKDFEAIDPNGQLSPDQFMEQALRIAAKHGDVKTVQSVLDRQTQRGMERERLDLSRNKANKPQWMRGIGLVEFDENGRPNVLMPEPTKEKSAKSYWLHNNQTGEDKLVAESDINEYTGLIDSQGNRPWEKLKSIGYPEQIRQMETMGKPQPTPSPATGDQGVPKVGQDFNGSKVKKVTKIR